MPPSDGAIQKAIAARDSADGNDLLSEWGTKTIAPNTSSSQSDYDLIDEWVAQKPTGTITVKPYVSGSSEQTPSETPGERVARLAAESGGGIEGKATRFGAGIVRGVGNVADTLAQGIAYTGEKGAGLAEQSGIITPETHRGVIEWRKRINADIAREQEAFKQGSAGSRAASVGEFGGELLGTAPFLGGGGRLISSAAGWFPKVAKVLSSPIASGAGVGGAINALTSSTSDEPLINQVGKGAILGAAGGKVGQAIGKALTSGVGAAGDLATKAIDKYGIPLRADQMSANPMVKFLGSVVQRLPLTGFGAHAAEQQNAFNRAIAGEFGETADKVTTDVIDRAKDRIGNVFDNVAARTGAINIDHPFVGAVSNIIADAKSVLGKDARPIESQVERIVDRIDQRTWTISSDAYQSLTRKGTPLDRAMHSNDPNVRFYAGQLREAIDDMMERSAPADVVGDLKTARYQWAVMRSIEPLAQKAPTGDISPALVLGATKGHRGSLMELGHIGQRFLKEPPSSGTAERLAVMGALGAGVGGLAYYDPEHFQRNALEAIAGLVAARAGGSALTSKWLPKALIKSGRSNLPVASVVRKATPGATALIGRNLLPQRSGAPALSFEVP